MKHTEAQLRGMSKDMLVQMHLNNGGLMLRSVYLRWRKDELVSAVLGDEEFFPDTA